MEGVTWPVWVCAAMLLVATFVAFLPVFEADFLSTWDDSSYVRRNPLLRDVSGLKEIWNPSQRALPQYYPIVFTSYWIEYQLWQLNPVGYHATNLALHLVNVVLAMLLVQRLGASRWLALGAAAVFALHPLQAGSVVWIAERKNTLSGFFYLGAFLLYLRHRRSGNWSAYWLALLAYAGALLSKTQTATLPVAIVLTEWLFLDRRKAPRIAGLGLAARVAPMFAFALVSSIITVSVEARTMPADFHPSPIAERFLIAAAAAWFYVGKFLVPIDLAPIYPKWDVELSNPIWWLALLAWSIVFTAALRWRRQIGVWILWGAGHFIVSFAPALGLVPFAYQRFSYVANHLLYLSCLGGGFAGAALVDRIAGRGRSRRIAVLTAALSLLVFYGIQTHLEARHWRDTLTLWSRALHYNPDNYLIHINLARRYRAEGRWPETLKFFQSATELLPQESYEYHYALGQSFRALGRLEGRDAITKACNEELKRNPSEYAAYLNRAESYEASGRLGEAIADYRNVMRFAPRGSVFWQMGRDGRDRVRRAKSDSHP